MVTALLSGIDTAKRFVPVSYNRRRCGKLRMCVEGWERRSASEQRGRLGSNPRTPAWFGNACRHIASISSRVDRTRVSTLLLIANIN